MHTDDGAGRGRLMLGIIDSGSLAAMPLDAFMAIMAYVGRRHFRTDDTGALLPFSPLDVQEAVTCDVAVSRPSYPPDYVPPPSRGFGAVELLATILADGERALNELRNAVRSARMVYFRRQPRRLPYRFAVAATRTGNHGSRGVPYYEVRPDTPELRPVNLGRQLPALPLPDRQSPSHAQQANRRRKMVTVI